VDRGRGRSFKVAESCGRPSRAVLRIPSFYPTLLFRPKITTNKRSEEWFVVKGVLLVCVGEFGRGAVYGLSSLFACVVSFWSDLSSLLSIQSPSIHPNNTKNTKEQ
jgi:hypothetical protein